ncbi:MAG: class I SAM-dependent methyltransferase [Anaerolineales bacterium]
MSKIWNAAEYDVSRRRLIPCYDLFYGTAVELACRTVKEKNPSILDIGAGTGLLSEHMLERFPTAKITLLDESSEMLAKAQIRLGQYKPKVFVQTMTSALPSENFHAVISSLAIHHLSDKDKRDLFKRIFDILEPGGIFINAEQILGETPWQQSLFEESHLDGARALGSSEEEIQAAVDRMSYDKCSPLQEQISWLKEIGFENAASFFHSFRFAVYAGWKPK